MNRKLVQVLVFLFVSNLFFVLMLFGSTITRSRIVASLATTIPQHGRLESVATGRICAGHKNHSDESKYTADNSPLLCIFTTFKPSSHKIKVYNNTLYNWIHLDEQSRVKPILYVTNSTFDNETLSTLACRLGWEVLDVPRVNVHGVPYLREMYNYTAQQFPQCAFLGYSNGDILYTRGLLHTLAAVHTVQHVLRRILIVGKRTNFPCCDGPLFLPDDVTIAARRKGSLFRSDAEDYFFVASNVFPWELIRDVVIGRSAYDNYLVGMAIKHNVSVVDATNTLLALHQTDKDGNYAGHSNPDGHFNHRVIGGFNYNSGRTDSSQFYTQQNISDSVYVYRRQNNARISV